jgi:membrane-associated phospholipid phosphatase
MTATSRFHEEEIPLPRLRTISTLWACAAVLAGLGVAALFVDVPLAQWIRGGNCPNWIYKISSLGEVFGHGLGVVLIVITISVLDPWHRHAVPRILAASLGSGLLANVLKLGMARTRPHHFDLSSRALESFMPWLPLGSNSSWEQSFPSAHTATAAGLSIVLACYYPRGRWLFPAFAALVGLERTVAQSHFLSDVLWGAAVGCIFAPLCAYGSRLARVFDRLEETLLAGSGAIAGVRALHRHGPAKNTTSGDAPHVA